MWSAGSTDLFSSREISLLIELVEALPVLYAADKKSYKSVIPREKAWKIISEKLNRTVSECEKKWRYLRDKYVKERRKLIDEAKSLGREVKSSWQHYESMEFLANHLRLPGNDRGSCFNGDDEDSMRYSEHSPTTLSPNTRADASAVKQEESPQPQISNWQQDQMLRTHSTTEPYQTNSHVLSPSYHGMFARNGVVPSFSHHPLWTMWANGLSQTNNTYMQQKRTNKNTVNESPNSSHTVNNESDTEPHTKKAKITGSNNQDINIRVSLKDLQPAEKFSEYHFCMSLAQMIENVPLDQRSELKIKLIQMVTSSSRQKEANSKGP